jgi:hypothetical protein
LTTAGLTELKGSPFRRPASASSLPVAAWHATVGKRALKGIAKGDPVLVFGQLATG